MTAGYRLCDRVRAPHQRDFGPNNNFTDIVGVASADLVRCCGADYNNFAPYIWTDLYQLNSGKFLEGGTMK